MLMAEIIRDFTLHRGLKLEMEIDWPLLSTAYASLISGQAGYDCSYSRTPWSFARPYYPIRKTPSSRPSF